MCSRGVHTQGAIVPGVCHTGVAVRAAGVGVTLVSSAVIVCKATTGAIGEADVVATGEVIRV